MKKFILASLFVGFLINAEAQLLLQEDFNYTSTGNSAADSIQNPAIGGSVWKKHSGTGNAIFWTSTGLTYAGYAGSGIGGSINLAHRSASSDDVNAALADSIKTGNVYVSFLVNVTVTGGTVGDYSLHLSPFAGSSISSIFQTRFFFKDTLSGSVRFGLSKQGASAAAVWSTNAYTVGQTYLIVLKYTFNPTLTNDDVCSMYIFSSGVPSVEPGSADIVATDVATDLSKVYGLALRQGTVGTGAAIFDGIRVATSWNFAPLPIKLSAFNAVGLKNIVNLSWLTYADQTGGSFVVERSIDGSNFENVSTIAANSLGNSSYEVTDRNLPAVKTLYYRLKIVNADGRFEYSTIQKVQLRDVKLTVSPNPAFNEILVNASENIKSIEVYDIHGRRMIIKDNINVNQTRINVTTLKDGTYIVKTLVDGEVTTNQIMVKH